LRLEEQDLATLDLLLPLWGRRGVLASCRRPDSSMYRGQFPKQQPKHGAQCQCSAVLTRSQGWPRRREVIWRRDCLEQAELTASSLVGLEKHQMVLHA